DRAKPRHHRDLLGMVNAGGQERVCVTRLADTHQHARRGDCGGLGAPFGDTTATWRGLVLVAGVGAGTLLDLARTRCASVRALDRAHTVEPLSLAQSQRRQSTPKLAGLWAD